MHLDVSTLMIAGAFVASMTGGLLLFAWYQYRETSAALWWAGSDFVLAAAIVLMALSSDLGMPLLFVTAMALLCLSASFVWAGAVSFGGEDVSIPLVLAGPLLWIIAQVMPPPVASPTGFVILKATISVSYYVLAAWSIGSGERLHARIPLIGLLTVHAVTLMVAVPATLFLTLRPGQPAPILSIFGVIHFEVIVFVIGTAIFLIFMMRERVEGRLVALSLTDPLTGLLNRRGFFQKAERVASRSARDDTHISVVAFDLDHFKMLNDTYGHATGDRVLQAFAEVCERVLRPGDIVGRVGGEEFAALISSADSGTGSAAAERVRHAFIAAVQSIDGVELACTVSAGVAVGKGGVDIDSLLQRADAALYRAKASGRNRVESDKPSLKVVSAA